MVGQLRPIPDRDMAGVFGWGYARVAVKASFCKANGNQEKDTDKRFAKYNGVFAGKFQSNFEIQKSQFIRKSKDLVNIFNKWKTKDKHEYSSHFSPEKWKSLPQIQKQQHTRESCGACTVHHFLFQSKFPVKSNFLLAKGEARGLTDITNKPKFEKQKPVKPTQTAIIQAAETCLEALEPKFQKIFQMKFVEALSKSKKTGLQKKFSKSECKSINRKQKRQEKQHMSSLLKENEALTFLANRKSFKQYDSERKTLFFEPKEVAQKRVEKRHMQEDLGIVKKKRHSPDHNSLEFDKAGMINEINNKKEGEEVQFTLLLLVDAICRSENCKLKHKTTRLVRMIHY